MKSSKAILVALALVGMVIGGPAMAKDSNGYFKAQLDPVCSDFLSEYEKSVLDYNGKKLIYSARFGDEIGWITGYMTRVNATVKGKKNFFNNIVDEVAWIASWCRDDPSRNLSQAIQALTNARTR